MARRIGDQVVVITGASSGIGRETALEMAQRGASVVLAARNEEALRQVARQCEEAGGRAHIVVTDVSRWEDVSRLAEEAVAWGGRIDTWINNAAAGLYGTVEELSVEEIERVVQVDLMGQIYGMKAVLPVLRAQNAGTIVNVASVVAERSVPLQAPYCAAKAGIKGFTDSLRMELAHEKSPIQVTLILPASVNTPFFEHARSRMGVKPRPVAPVYEPEIVAQAIVSAAEHPKRDVFVGGAGKMMTTLEHSAPGVFDAYMVQGGRMFRQQQRDEIAAGTDSLFEPSQGSGAVHGEFGGESLRRSAWTSLFEMHPDRKRIAAGALAFLGGAALVALSQSLRAGSAQEEGLTEEEWDEEARSSCPAYIDEMEEMAMEGEPFFYW